MMKRLLSLTCSLPLLLLGPATTLVAQSGLGSIGGTVVDQSRGVIQGATITLVEASTKSTRTTLSNEVGLFTIPSVPVGKYTLTIAKESFKTKQIDELTVNSFQRIALGEVALDVGAALTETVEVVAATTLITDSGVRSESIQANQVSQMPLQGRNWSTLLKVIPGSNPTNGDAFNGREYSATGYADFRINGKQPGQSQVNLDGGSLVDHGSDAKTTVAPSLESIQEVSVLTNNFQAEYGNRGGTVINIVTKSGTNEFHGAVFDYLRNEALNANSWENNFLGRPKGRYRFNYFGANVGGPILKNKLFFFYNFENFKQDVPGGTQQGRVPTLLERKGDFSQTADASGKKPTIYMPGTQASGSPVLMPNNVIPQELINPLGLAILNLYPEPNNPNDPNNNYVLNYSEKDPRWSNTLKIDWNISDKSRAFARVTADDGVQVKRSVSNTSGIFPFSAVKRPRPDRALSSGFTHVFSPALVMENLFAWSYDHVEWLPDNPEQMKKSAHGLSGLPTVFPTSDDILPAVTIGTGANGYSNFAFNRMPADATANEWQVATTLSWSHGTHLVKGGLQYIRNRKDELTQSENKGFYDFSPNSGSLYDTGYAPANVLVGALNAFRQIENVNFTHSVYEDVHFFIQDSWKARKNLTLDYGLRLYHIPTEHQMDSSRTLDAAFVPSLWDPAQAPRYYVPDPKNPKLVIDPAHPDQPLPANLAGVLRYTIVPGSGDPLNGIVQLGTNGLGQAGIPDPPFVLFAPRGGFAWTPFERTVIRGGFGWAYNRENIADAINRFENVLGDSISLAQTSLGTLASSSVRPITPKAGQTANAVGVRNEGSNKKPTTYDYSLSVQQQLFSSLVLDLAYIGNVQKNQSINFNINSIPLGTAFLPQYVDPQNAGYNFYGPVSASNPGALPGSNTMNDLVMRPYQGFNSLQMNSNVGTVKYNALQVGIRKRASKGLSFQAYYTLGRTKGNIENIGASGAPFPNLGNWKDYTGYKLNTDRLHVLNLNYTYELPKLAEKLHFDNVVGRVLLNGWQIAHLFVWFSGQDYSPTFSIQQANTTTELSGSGLSRVILGTPDVLPRPATIADPNLASPDLARQFDPSKLGVPAIYPGSAGTGEMNYLQGLGGFSNDLSVFKKFDIGHGRGLEVRANFYNVFNQTRHIAQGTNAVNLNVLYKAQGRAFTDGFQVYNAPEQLQARAAATGVTNPMTLFNGYRTGVGHVNLTGSDQPSRIIEIGIALRF